jgi:hypothetical protein
LPRRVEILRAVAAAGLPFAVPEPLTAVATFGERAAVAVSWIDGEWLPEGIGDPAAFGLLLEALREVEISPKLEAALHTPRRYADGLGWADILSDEIIPRLPTKWRDRVRQLWTHCWRSRRSRPGSSTAISAAAMSTSARTPS